MKRVLTLTFLLLTASLFAQFPDTYYETKEIREKAEKLTMIYDAQLGLDGTQLPIFQDKVADYLTLSEKVKKEFDGKEELDMLTRLMVEESLEMQDLLTRIQYNVYKKIRQDIQPLKIVDTDSK